MIPKPATVALLGGWRATAFAGLALILLAATGVQTARLHYQEGRNAKLAAALGKAQADAQIAARKAEAEKAQAIATIDAQHEKEMADAKAARDRTIDGLRAGNRKLRDEWAGCPASVPGIAPGSGESDDAAERRISGAGRAFEAVDDDAAKIRALQEIVKADRK